MRNMRVCLLMRIAFVELDGSGSRVISSTGVSRATRPNGLGHHRRAERAVRASVGAGGIAAAVGLPAAAVEPITLGHTTAGDVGS